MLPQSSLQWGCVDTVRLCRFGCQVYRFFRMCIAFKSHTNVYCTQVTYTVYTTCRLDSRVCITQWRRCRGCLKLQVTFCKRAADYRNLLEAYNLQREGILGCLRRPVVSWLTRRSCRRTGIEQADLTHGMLSYNFAAVGSLLGLHTCQLSYYGLATISRLLKNTGLFCKRALKKRPNSAKEAYNFKEPTNRSHFIWYTKSCLAEGRSK